MGFYWIVWGFNGDLKGVLSGFNEHGGFSSPNCNFRRENMVTEPMDGLVAPYFSDTPCM